VNAVVFGSKGKRMFTADAAGAVAVWNVELRNGPDSASYTVRRRVVLPGMEGVSIVAMALHPTLSQLAVLGQGNTLRLLDAAYTTLPVVRTFPGVRCSNARLNVVFSPDGRYLAAGSEDGEVGIWETDSGLVVEGAGQAGGARSMYIMGFGTQDGTALNDVDWHPSQHMIALSAFGRGNPIMLYVNDAEEGRG
jgi:WD40 repeat protein